MKKELIVFSQKTLCKPLTNKMMSEEKIILDLCGGTGSWSKQYKDAGYDVRLVTTPDNDVRTYQPPNNVYGILAAPPCTMFSRARTTAKTPRDFKQGMETVNACLRIIWSCLYDYKDAGGRPLKFWALENPKGFLRWFLGKPPFEFNPYDFGDRYRKPTDIWGLFNEPKKSPVELTDKENERMGTNSRRLPILPGMPKDRAARRAITPPGFAQAFFKANP